MLILDKYTGFKLLMTTTFFLCYLCSFRQVSCIQSPMKMVILGMSIAQAFICSDRTSRHLFTGRNEVVAKVMFLQVCVCPQGGEGVCLSACWDAIPPPDGELWRTPPDGEPPPGMENREADSSIRSTSGRYASYWNSFLFGDCFNPTQAVIKSQAITKNLNIFLGCKNLFLVSIKCHQEILRLP